MAKFTAEEKINAVLRYFEGKDSIRQIAKSVGTDPKSIRNWVKQYEYNGEKAFIKRYTNYSAEDKVKVIYELRHKYSVKALVAFAEISRSTYYDLVKKDEST